MKILLRITALLVAVLATYLPVRAQTVDPGFASISMYSPATVAPAAAVYATAQQPMANC
ncbi:hypothetical protein [Hymenobacter lucidus]|uniref:Uncharacterized protein n=1 Tax=Hymenobacter lucidus TaxID=2880930 RepID=A0ABS8AU89_9BACT|nr:hypothetical protein [Hymenobacter lucidus]MCB2409309.1 hypothetical protein [Hymenobacter lucidus]